MKMSAAGAVSAACIAVMATILTACARLAVPTFPSAPQAVSPSTVAPIYNPAGKLMIFGGANHTVYLGCLNCSFGDGPK